MTRHIASCVLVNLFLVSSTLLTAARANTDDLRVRDIPIPEGAEELSVMKRRGDIRFNVDKSFHATSDYYAKKLVELGWKKSNKQNTQSTFLVRSYTKGNAALEVRVAQRDGGSEVRLTPTGMMWDEDDQPTPRDLPFPQNATELEYDEFFESIEFKSPESVESVVAYLTKELEQRKWSKKKTEVDLASFVRMTFEFDKSILTIDVRGNDSGSEIAIRTDGMQWDGMQEEIARAEAKAESERQATKPETAEPGEEIDSPKAVAELPPRKQRPKQGIENLEKLSSLGRIVMDGTEFKLESVIAYEVYEYERWMTKIVATQKSIKQETLIARLRKTGTDRDENDFSLTWSEPYLELVLDDEDRPQSLVLRAAGVPGTASSDELAGTALIEDGRARGEVKLAEPGSFFDNVYTAELTFDTNVLTRNSVAEKRLANASKLPNSGSLTIGGKTYKLQNVVAYPMVLFDEPMTAVVISEEALNSKKLEASLGTEAANDYFEFTPQVKLLIDADDVVHSISIWADNYSLNGSENVRDEIAIEDGRVRGSARMTEPSEFFDKKYSFELTFDVNLLGSPSPKSKANTSGLEVDAYDGLPVPAGHTGMQSEASRFRMIAQTEVKATLQQLLDFYRSELTTDRWGNWKENGSSSSVDKDSARLVFDRESESLIVELKSSDDGHTIDLIRRDAAAAQKAGLLPSRGKARLIVANTSSRATTLVINRQEYQIAAGAGAEDPRKGLNWEVGAGTFTVAEKGAQDSDSPVKLTLQAGEIWGVVIDPEGQLMIVQLY